MLIILAQILHSSWLYQAEGPTYSPVASSLPRITWGVLQHQQDRYEHFHKLLSGPIFGSKDLSVLWSHCSIRNGVPSENHPLPARFKNIQTTPKWHMFRLVWALKVKSLLIHAPSCPSSVGPQRLHFSFFLSTGPLLYFSLRGQIYVGHPHCWLLWHPWVGQFIPWGYCPGWAVAWEGSLVHKR